MPAVATPASLLDTADELVAGCAAELRAGLPVAADIVDVHTHLGRDVDGMIGDRSELLETLDRFGIAAAFTFCLDEPDRSPAFSAPNDRTLAHAHAAGDRLIPFLRLDLEERPIDEARRCLELGARGIKLHPRAQRFSAGDGRLSPVFAIAAEHGVPILIHGGHGLPPIADHLHDLVHAHPGTRLIIAHAGVADMGNLARRLGGVPGVYFDTSTWSPLDLLDLFRRVPAQQILYASDYPYGQQPSSLFATFRVAKLAGLDERRLRAVLGANARGIAGGDAPPVPEPATGAAAVTHPVVLARIHQYVSMAAPLLWRQRRDFADVLGLAVSACDGEELERVGSMLATARALWRSMGDLETDTDRRTAGRATFQLLQLVDVLAVAPG